jgi:hypothetical protein
MPDEVPASWYAADLPEEQRAALQHLHGVQQRTRRAARDTVNAAPPAVACAHAQPWTPAADEPDAAPAEQLVWAGWQQRQAVYSYWWWHFCRRTVARCDAPTPAPWAAPPWPQL